MATRHLPVFATLALMVDLSSMVAASSVVFVSPKTDFIPNLTDMLTMTCSFNGSDVTTITTTPQSGSAVIGKRGLSTPGKRGLSTSGSTVDFLSSLVITRNGLDPVASITEHTPATAQTDLNNLKVQGQILGNSGVLHLSWTYPTDAQKAVYTCEANGMTVDGHFSSLKEHLEISTSELDMNTIAKYISDQQKAIAGLQATVTDQQKEIANLRNVQTGIIDCGGPAGYVGNLIDWNGSQDKYKVKTVNFNQTYIRAPEVHLSFSFVDEGCHAFFRSDLLSVSTTNFTMRCRGYGRCLPDYMLVNWVSIPQ